MSDLWSRFKQQVQIHTEHVSAETLDYSINVSLQYKYIYVETPKVGCSSIKLSLQRMELNNANMVWPAFMDVHNRDASPLLKPSQLFDINPMLKDPDFKKFCFVRNPYTRLLSAYLDKIVNNRPPKKSILEVLGCDLDDMQQEISFSQFVDAIGQQSTVTMNPHWRPQYYQTFQDSIAFDTVGKFENFRDDFARLMLSLHPHGESFIAAETRHQTNALQLLEKHYSQEIASRVCDIYRKDFSHFDYDQNVYAV